MYNAFILQWDNYYVYMLHTYEFPFRILRIQHSIFQVFAGFLNLKV